MEKFKKGIILGRIIDNSKGFGQKVQGHNKPVTFYSEIFFIMSQSNSESIICHLGIILQKCCIGNRAHCDLSVQKYASHLNISNYMFQGILLAFHICVR